MKQERKGKQGVQKESKENGRQRRRQEEERPINPAYGLASRCIWTVPTPGGDSERMEAEQANANIEDEVFKEKNRRFLNKFLKN